MRRSATGLMLGQRPKLVGGGQTGFVLTSLDGITWSASQPAAFGSTGNISDVKWIPELNLWVAAADNGVIATSPDGLNWTSRTSQFGTSQVLGIGWSPSLGLLVAVGISGKISTSPDGITWTARTSGTSFVLRKVAWSPTQGIFVVSTDTSGAQGVLTSTDGINWTTRVTSITGSTSIMDVVWAASLAKFYVIAATGQMSSSPDGINWSSITAQLSSANALAWSPTVAKLVQAGGAGGSAFYSSNGTVWSPATNQFGTTSVSDVTWAPDVGLYLMSGGSGKLATSPDAINWTLRTTGYAGFILTVGGK